MGSYFLIYISALVLIYFLSLLTVLLQSQTFTLAKIDLVVFCRMRFFHVKQVPVRLVSVIVLVVHK